MKITVTSRATAFFTIEGVTFRPGVAIELDMEDKAVYTERLAKELSLMERRGLVAIADAPLDQSSFATDDSPLREEN